MKKEHAEIELRVPENGELSIPSAVLGRLNVRHGQRVHIHVTASILTDLLKKRSVTEEEIERIAALQLEPRENVIKFLATESRLWSDNGFRRRSQRLRGKF